MNPTGKNKPKPVVGKSIYKDRTVYWESINAAAVDFGVSAIAVRRHIDNGEPFNGFIIKRRSL